MPHDKIKAATRMRMAETGEPYSVARRAVIRAHRATQGQIDPADAARSADPVTSPIGRALPAAIGQAFEPLDRAIRPQVVEVSK